MLSYQIDSTFDITLCLVLPQLSLKEGAMLRFVISLILLPLTGLLAGCPSVTLQLNAGASGGWHTSAVSATHRSRPVCSWSESNYRPGSGVRSHSSYQSCEETYILGDQLCRRSWTQSFQVQNAPGKKNDSTSRGYSSSMPYCRPLTSEERKFYFPQPPASTATPKR